MSVDCQAEYKIKRITIIGAILNISLSALKIVAGLMFGSMSVVVDGLHSLSDLATDVVILVCVPLSSRKPDAKHPYGHTWYETFATVTISAALVAVGLMAIYKSSTPSENLSKGAGLFVLLAAALSSIILKELLYQRTCDVARATNCSAVYANAWHHRSDAFSSVAVLIGLVAQSLGFHHGDQVAAIIVGAMIVAAGLKILTGTMRDFTNAAVDRQTIELIQNIITSNPAIRQMHKLRSRSVGREIFLDFHILVDSYLNVRQAHQISMEVEDQIRKNLTVPVNIIVHIEPDEPDFRK